MKRNFEMRLFVKNLALAVAVLGIAFATPQARATTLLPGTTVVPGAEVLDPLSGTTILANTGVQNFNVIQGGNSLVGTGQSWAVTGYLGNPFGTGDITIVYQVSLTGGTTGTSPPLPQVIERVTGSSFDSFMTDVGYFVQSSPLGEVPPTTASRTASGNIIAFDTLIPVGSTSALLIVNTNATGFTTGTLTVQDGLTANLNGFSPTAVPEPTSLVLLAGLSVGAAGVGAVRRWRNGQPAAV